MGCSSFDALHSCVQVEAVREELARMKARDPGAKAIVFSQFTSMLDILHFRLTQARCDIDLLTAL